MHVILFKNKLKAIFKALYKLLKKLITFLSFRNSNNLGNIKYLSKLVTFAIT